MTLKEVRGKLTTEDMKVLDGSVMRKAVLEHCNEYFDELVAALEQCKPDGDWESDEDLETFKKLRKDVLARAKEVKK